MAAFSILIFTSISALLACSRERLHFLQCLPFQCDGWMVSWKFSNAEHLVLSPLILIPHWVQAQSRALSFCCSSFLFSATRVRSSAYWAFWMQVVNAVLSLYGTVLHWWCTRHVDPLQSSPWLPSKFCPLSLYDLACNPDLINCALSLPEATLWFHQLLQITDGFQSVQ